MDIVNVDGEVKGASGKPKKERPTKAPKNHGKGEEKPEGEDETDSLLQAVVNQQLGSGVRYRKKAAARKHAAKRKSSKPCHWTILFSGCQMYTMECICNLLIYLFIITN